jgi:uncharacterized protein YndB with AHSA1/START domain
MQLTATEDIEAPLDRVFAEVADLETLERQAMRRGIAVQRHGAATPPAPGLGWTVQFQYRGKRREAEISLTEYTAPERIAFHSVSGGLETGFTLDLIALSRSRTRINVATELMPKTLSARLLVQSLKLAKGGLDKRFRQRMAALARDLEARVQRGA